MASRTREATHAGSWYTSNGKKLRDELAANLAKVHALPDLDFHPPVSDAKAVIAPHAGYSYSGPAAAWAYAAIPTEKIKRVFLLGPSHHAHIPGAALSTFKQYATPLGDIPLCLDTIVELRKTGAFSDMKPSVDEDEHSLEMHLPFIRHIFAGRDDVRLVPILVGHPSVRTLNELNEALAPYWKDESTFFIISSDFCHWGTRFSCTPYYPTAPSPPNPVPPVPAGEHAASYEPPELVKRFSASAQAKAKSGGAAIWESIQFMDHEGIELLRDPAGLGAREKWEAYLDRTKNTICGRNPISVLLSLIQHVHAHDPADSSTHSTINANTEAEAAEAAGGGAKPRFTFVRYEQSSKCFDAGDSSVSYVSGVLRMPKA